MTTRKYFYLIPTRGEESGDDLGELVLRLNSAGADFEFNLMVASQIVHCALICLLYYYVVIETLNPDKSFVTNLAY